MSRNKDDSSHGLTIGQSLERIGQRIKTYGFGNDRLIGAGEE